MLKLVKKEHIQQVLYIHIDESVWHQNTEPKLFRARFVKRLRPVEKYIFKNNVVTLNS